MIYNEEHRDLFEVSKDYYLAHCISADFGMGAGIVVQFNQRFDMKNILKKKYKSLVGEWESTPKGNRGFCLLEGRVFNLVTKQYVFQKPTYEELKGSLYKMKIFALELGVTKIAMPLIGCGIDGLDWNRVSGMIKEVFADTAIEILVCIKE